MRLRLISTLTLFVAAAAFLVACGGSSSSSTPTPAATSSATQAPAITPTPAPGGSATPAATVTPAPSPTASAGAVIGPDNFQSLHAVSTASLQNVQFLAWQTGSGKLLIASRHEADLLTPGSNNLQSVYTAQDPEGIVALSSTGVIATSSDQNTINLHNAQGTSMGSIDVGGAFGSVVFSPDGSMVAIGRLDKIAVDLWDVQQDKLIKELTGFNTAAPVYSASFSPDGKSLIWLARATVQLQDIASGQMGARVEHEDFVSGLALTTNDATLVTASAQIATVWNAQTGAKVTELQQDGITREVALLSNQQYVAIATGTDLALWDLSAQQQVGVAQLVERQLALSPDGRMLAVVDDNVNTSILAP